MIISVYGRLVPLTPTSGAALGSGTSMYVGRDVYIEADIKRNFSAWKLKNCGCNALQVI